MDGNTIESIDLTAVEGTDQKVLSSSELWYGGVTNIWTASVVYTALHRPGDAIVAIDAAIIQ